MTDTDVRRIEDKVDAVGITLARLEGSLSPTLDKLTSRANDQEGEIADHEKRIRALERFRFSVPSVALLALLVAAGTLVYYLTSGVGH